jgi:hypothetical protein
MNKKDMDLGSGFASKKRRGPKDMDLGSGTRKAKPTNLQKDMDLGTGKRKAKPSNLQKDMDLGSGTRKASKTIKKVKKDVKKPRIVSKKELDASGLSLRDFLNKERGLTRRDGKKVVKKKKKIDFSKIVSSAKKSKGKKAST